LEAEVLKLGPQARARLAALLLDSLESLSVKESEELWLAEAERRDAAWDSNGQRGRPAADVFRDATARLS
jgi:Putative addiction module component